MNGDLGRTWEKVVMACFKVLSWYLPAGTERNHEKCQSVWQGPPQYEAGVLPAQCNELVKL